MQAGVELVLLGPVLQLGCNWADPGTPRGRRSAPTCPGWELGGTGRNWGGTGTAGVAKGPRSAPGDPGVPRGPRGTQERPRGTLASPETPTVPKGTPVSPDGPQGTPSPPEDPGVPKGTPAPGGGARYRLRVTTGSQWGGGTLAAVTLSLVGTRGQSHPCHLDWPLHRLRPDTTVVAEVTSAQPLGTLLLLRLWKEPLVSLVPDRWFCARVTVTGPLGDGDDGGVGDDGDGDDGDTPKATFPCYRWLESGCLELREGTARTPRGAAWEPQLLQQRQEERREREEAFQWAPYAPGWPWRLRALPPALCPWPPPPPASPPSPSSPSSPSASPPRQLSPSLAFPLGHRASIAARAAAAQVRVRLRGLRSGGSWRSFEDIQEALGSPGTPISEYVVQHWQDDAFFGEQYLSGVNPVLLRRCSRLPPNFPVTPPMVAPSLGPATCLQREMEGGRLFLADYAVLEGLPTGRLGGDPQFLAAPLCLLWLSPRQQLLPIAIQLSQRPGPEAPIFVPGDGPWGWALAKLWVRGAHFALHEMVAHLLHSHFLGETFAMATLRLPACHPLHQLLLPHCRFTFHINILARETLLNPGGIIDQATAIGREGTLELVARGTAALTYTELCVPDDMEHRGVTDIPNYHYRDDALEIWGAIESLVEGIVALYYPEDSDVAEDHELQDWVGEIFTYAVLGNEKTGFPSKLCSRPELVKFVTMIIFCCSARHAAVNSGQYDYAAWMPNTPGTLRRPPPRRKEEATAELLLETLPSPEATGALLALLSVVSYESGEPRPLGSRSQEPFSGAAPRRLLATFRQRMAAISHRIRQRNEGLALPYPYLDPACVQESVSI